MKVRLVETAHGCRLDVSGLGLGEHVLNVGFTGGDGEADSFGLVFRVNGDSDSLERDRLYRSVLVALVGSDEEVRVDVSGEEEPPAVPTPKAKVTDKVKKGLGR